ncbi:MAG: toprim domain-containing protein [Novosphingobium sp.]
MQDAQGARLVARLGGVWRNGKGLCLCPAHADHDPSLSVRVGERALLFKCFAGCTTIDVVRAIHRLGLPMANSAAGHTPYRPTNTSAGTGTALRAWNASVPLAGTPAEVYLSRRFLKPRGDDLRFNAHTPLGRGRDVVFRPAMLAAVREHRTIVAVHRTFLDPAGLDPAGGRAGDLTRPRMLLGSPGRGAVQLMPASRVLGLAEGIETALAAMAVHRIPVWATLGTTRADRIALPDGLERLVLLFDRDAAGSAACRRARKAYVRAGLELNDIWPPVPHNDWADVLVSIRRNHSKSGD